jgi:hypothetical protein
MRRINAEIVPDSERWAGQIPPISDFDAHDAYRAIDALKADITAEYQRLAAIGEHLSPTTVDALNSFLDMDDWLARVGTIPPTTIARFRADLLNRGRRVYQTLGPTRTTNYVGDAEPHHTTESSVIDIAILIGGAWLLNRLLGRHF